MVPGHYLSSIQPFSFLEPHERAQLARSFDEMSYEKGSALFRRGEKRGTMFVVLEGEIELQVLVAGTVTPMIIFQTHDVISANSLFDNTGAHYQTAVVRSPHARLLALTFERYQNLKSELPRFEQLFMQWLAQLLDQRLDHANRKLLALMAVGGAAASTKAFSELSERILPILAETLRARHIALIGRNSARGRWEYWGVSGDTSDARMERDNQERALPTSWLDHIERERATAWLQGDEARLCQVFDVSNELILTPCIHQGSLVAVLAVGDRMESHFSVNTVLHLESVSSILAAGIHRLQEEVEQRGREELKRQYPET